VKALFNFVVYQVGWFACVLGAAQGWVWWGIGVGGIVVLWNSTRAARPMRELTLVANVVVIGFFWDSLMVQTQLIRFAADWPLVGVAPLWIVMVWAQFATTLNVSLRWLHRRWLLAAMLGAVAAPLSYLAGQRMGALIFPHQTVSLVVIAVGWGIITPLLVWLAERFDGSRLSSAAQTEPGHV
jgi:Protein of unknown function (DUF2878)